MSDNKTVYTKASDGTMVVTTDAPTAVVVFIHGLGDGHHSWLGWIGMLAEMLPHVKFVLPVAAQQHVTVNHGRVMPSWFDIVSLQKSEGDYSAGIEDSVIRIGRIIDTEIANGFPPSRIVLGGISQGGALSLFTGFQAKTALAGVFCLSGYIPRMNVRVPQRNWLRCLLDTLMCSFFTSTDRRHRRRGAKAFAVTRETKEVPLLMCHGEADAVVSFAWGTKAKETLDQQGVRNIEFHAYPTLQHCMCLDEVVDMEKWLRRILPPAM